MFVANLIREINRFLPDWNVPITNKHRGCQVTCIYSKILHYLKQNLLESLNYEVIVANSKLIIIY